MKKIFFAVFCIILFGCKKSETSSNPNFWHVKYEVTSTTSPCEAVIVYKDKNGGAIQVGEIVPTHNYQSLPWSYEADFSKDPGMLNRGLALALDDVEPRTSIVNFKIYVDGKLVVESTDRTSMLFYILNP